MIHGHRKLNLQDLSNRGKDLSIEVNWNKSVDKCEYLRVKIGDEEGIISQNHLYTLMLLITKPDQQANLIPTVQVPVSHYSTEVTCMAQQDLKKGQLYRLPISVSVNKITGQMSIKS